MGDADDYLRQLRAWERFSSEYGSAADRIRRAFDEHDRQKLEEGLQEMKGLLTRLVQLAEAAEGRAIEAEKHAFKMLLIAVGGVLVGVVSLIATVVLAVT